MPVRPSLPGPAGQAGLSARGQAYPPALGQAGLSAPGQAGLSARGEAYPPALGQADSSAPGLAWPQAQDRGDPAARDEDRPATELRPGIPWVAGIDQAAWRRAWRRAGDGAPSRWPDPHGLPSLRHALCGYLRRTRGLDCTPDHVLITRGVASGLSLLAAALLRPGERAGLEEPGYPVGRPILAARGVQVVPCPVDSHGLVTDRLPGDLRLVYSTPAHQYPLGGRLPVPRRQELVAWARATGALLVEDDYDSEFRYDVAPLPALYGLDPDMVAYLGTTAKTLTPSLGVGWLLARPDLVSRLADTRESLGDRTGEAA
jgi:GntR family transcriptional regulator/MocR family aminotransferase